jgi:hypothetical protein
MKTYSDKVFRWTSFVIYLIAGVYVLYNGMATTNDSASYIGMSSMRSPLYPLLIKLLYFIGGSSYKFCLLCFQTFFGAFGIYVFCSFVHRYFKMLYWLSFLLSICLLAPYIVFGEIANIIMTEAIAYPLFLIAIRFLTEAVLEKRARPFIFYMLCCIPLILTRGQFLFFYPVSIIAIIILFILNKEKRKRQLKVTVIFVLCIIFTALAERTYNFALYRQFDKVSLSGLQVSAIGFFVSEKSDSTLFKDSTEQKFFKGVLEITHQQNNWNLAYDKKTAGNSGFGYYQMVYNKIVWGAVYPEAKKWLPDAVKQNDLEGWKFINKLSRSVAFVLFKQHYKEILTIMLTNFVNGFGYKHYSLLLFVLFISVLWLSLKQKDRMAILFAFLLLICFLDVGIIALVEPTGEYRYLIYNDAIYTVILVISLNRWVVKPERI